MRRGNHGNGDGGVAARAAKTKRPSLNVRFDPIVLACVRIVAAADSTDVNTFIHTAVVTALNARTAP